MQIRRDKRIAILNSGNQAYPVTVPVTTTVVAVRERYAHLVADDQTGDIVGVAGRIMFMRNTGKLCFAAIQAGAGDTLQLMLSLDRVGEEALESWKALVDIGDIVAVEGEVISSKRGELSVTADRWQMASKALRPLPNLHKPLSEETRVRQRYADLIVRDTARTIARLRPAVIASLRNSFAQRDYIEVETPMLQTMHGGAAARPFVTRSNAFDMELFLRIAPELFLKRCVVGGMERVYEINRNFRNEGADASHSPEFAMLEFYQAYADYNDMADLTQSLIQDAALAVHGSLDFELVEGGRRDLSGQWERISVFAAVSEAVGQEITPRTPIETLRALCDAAEISYDPKAIHGKLVEELLEHYVVENLTRPTFVIDYPVDTSPLVRDHRSESGVVEKWDLYIDGYEAGTGYSELIDPIIQRERLVAQSQLKDGGDAEAMQLDEDFLRALEYGMPPSGGVGMGVDRLLMTLTGLNIRETILFPLVKPE
ncbi:MAG: lysine--tRNA ligase [Actinomycetes bacterium]